MQLVDFMAMEVINKYKSEIELAQDQEVLAKGRINPISGIIDELEILARGHSSATPAITKSLGPGTVLIHNHPSGNLSPSNADIRVASLVGNKGAGFLIVDNQLHEGYMVVEPYMSKERELLKVEKLLQYFQPDGILSKTLDKFEYRPQQIEMVKTIIFAFNNRRHLLAEAGTGTGKSLAYLLPAIYWSVLNDEKVVVSTNTINLQEQLYFKDIPLLKRVLSRILSRDFRSVLVKGRRNYICLRKLNFINQGYEDLTEEEGRVLTQINHLVFKNNVGSKSDFNSQPPSDLWEKVSSEAETCLRSKCPHFQGCYFQLARREAAGADLLIVNHHLLFADLAVRKERGDGEGILPKYQHLILDEAHNLEHVATEYLGYQITRYRFLHFLQYLFNTRAKNTQQGLLQAIRGSLTKSDLDKEQKYEALRLLDIEIIPVFLKVRDRGQHFFNQVAVFFKQYQISGENKQRLTQESTSNSEWEKGVVEAGEDLMISMHQLGQKLTLIYEQLKDVEEQNLPDYESLIIELEGRITQLQRFLKAIDFIINLEDNDYVYWMEVFYRKNEELFCTLQAAPLEIADEIKDQIVEAMDTVIFTSATLTVQKNFQYLRNNLGLNNDRVDDLMVGSPFNYGEQAMVMVVKDISSPDMQSYLNEVRTHLISILDIMKGRTLVLFTSYKMLNSFYYQLKEDLLQRGIRIYKQGEDSRKQIIENFKEGEKGVIFGTASFWEGIDIQGDDLSCVVIMKLPFLVPSEPIVEAKIEKMKREGKNPFINFMLPNAVIKFKQGFGRLVRSKDDRGIVLVFDPRIYTKSYGKVFLRSLPVDTQVFINSFEIVSKKVQDFI